IEMAPIGRRGWIYQERLLSPRILHYTSEQLFWECRREYLAEDELVTWMRSGDSQSMTVSSLVDHTG
ncbi:hypothetical protein AOQ84DRAFT_294015, partial [Glonium stellatum]